MHNDLVDKLLNIHCKNCDGENNGCTGCTIQKEIESVLSEQKQPIWQLIRYTENYSFKSERTNKYIKKGGYQVFNLLTNELIVITLKEYNLFKKENLI